MLTSENSTNFHMDNPAVGDIYHEMFSHVFEVIAVNSDCVVIKKWDGSIKAYKTVNEFKEDLKYKYDCKFDCPYPYRYYGNIKTGHRV